MRTDLDHLPGPKRRELERVVEIIFDEFGHATENATGRRNGARILKIVLFGSHARGDWVDAPLSANQYKRSEEHTSELQSLMRISYAVFCLKKKNTSQSKTDNS